MNIRNNLIFFFFLIFFTVYKTGKTNQIRTKANSKN